MSPRRFQASLVLAVSLASIRAVAEEPADEDTAGAARASDTSDKAADTSDETPPVKPRPAKPPTAQPPAEPAPLATDVKPPAEPEPSWHTEVHGYFRAPMALGISSRPSPDGGQDPNTGKLIGPPSTQIVYGPNRTIDANYYSFAYTRLQEQDWAEVFVHAKKKHVDAAVGWMGYWFQSVGFRNYDAAWAPGLAYVRLDTDLDLTPDVKPNIAFTAGAWWPSFGYFEKYDTYTLGRFRQLGGQLKLAIPFNPDWALNVTGGFGTNRDGSFNPGAPAFYGALIGVDLLGYFNAQVTYQKYVDASFHFSTEWTSDPNLTQQSTVGDKSYTAAKLAHLSVIGGEIHFRAPYVGHLWISPSYISVRNGWALGSAGTEVMHSLGGVGLATNYMAWTGSSPDSTGTGTMFNLGFLWEDTLSSVLGRPPGTLPEVTVSVFGLLADASLNLPATTTLQQFDPSFNIRSIIQFKYGVDATLQPLTWFGFMLRYDIVNYDLNSSGYVFDAITARTIFTSHFLSGERIYLQYSRYKYGDKMVLNGSWPWAAPLVAGANVLQQGPYSGTTPDENVVKLQAEIAF
jgi:hypothetical protein